MLQEFENMSTRECWYDGAIEKVILSQFWVVYIHCINKPQNQWNKQSLFDTPRTVMVNKKNYYREYKGHKR